MADSESSSNSSLFSDDSTDFLFNDDSPSSPLQEEEVGDAQDMILEPYLHEPLAPEGYEREEQIPLEQWRMNPERVQEWCKCGNCTVQPVIEENMCCLEFEDLCQKMESLNLAGECVLKHPGFEVNCLNEWVLLTSYFGYAKKSVVGDPPEKYRYCSYRQFTRLFRGRLGKDNRKPLPSCAYNSIRTKFTSENVNGFIYSDTMNME